MNLLNYFLTWCLFRVAEVQPSSNLLTSTSIHNAAVVFPRSQALLCPTIPQLHAAVTGTGQHVTTTLHYGSWQNTCGQSITMWMINYLQYLLQNFYIFAQQDFIIQQSYGCKFKATPFIPQKYCTYLTKLQIHIQKVKISKYSVSPWWPWLGLQPGALSSSQVTATYLKI